MGKNIGKSVRKYVSSEYSKKCLNHAKKSVTD